MKKLGYTLWVTAFVVFCLLVNMTGRALGDGYSGVPQQCQGQGDAGSTVTGTGFPFLVAGSDGTNARDLATTANGTVKVVSSPGAIAYTNKGTLTSNGTTAVVIVAASGSKTSFLGTTSIVNNGTVNHTVSIISSGGTVLAVLLIGPTNGFLIDSTNTVASLASEGLSFKIDAGGAGTDVTLTTATLQQ